MQYRVSFWMDFLATGFANGVYIITLALVLSRFGNIAGWTIGEVALLAGLAEVSFALMDMVCSGIDPDYFSPMVRMGRLDQYLLRPVNLMVQLFGSRFLLKRLGRITEGLLILAFCFLLTDIHWTTFKILYLPVIIICQVISMGSLFLVGSTITFWTVERIEAVNILTYGGVELMTYPMSIYPGWILRFFTYLVPFIFLNYYPALYILGKPDPLGYPSFAPFLAPLVALGMGIAALLFWSYGLKHYQSTGT
jgi:ABC-2 type transport system permease protein